MTQTAISPRNRTMKSYTPYTLPATLPYGVWISIPFRKRGSSTLRNEAKQRGARYNPHGITDDFRWWIPGRMLSDQTLQWLNDNEMITGERLHPKFVADAMGFTFAEIDFTRPVTLVLDVPYDNREDAKRMGARWDAQVRKWRVLNDCVTESILKDCITNKWAYILECHLKGNDRLVVTNFYSHDNGSAYTRPHGREWHFISQDGNTILSMKEDTVLLHRGGGESDQAAMLFICIVMGSQDAIAWHTLGGESKSVFNLLGYNTKDHAREIWNNLISGGWTVQERKR